MKKAKKIPAKKTKPAPKAPPGTKPRSIIQIALGGAEHWALCDDGTVWIGGPGNWTQTDVSQITDLIVQPRAEQKPTC